ncbi:Uncharacterised protein [Bordetella pertussis]|nr:Uncharacterised protein [Bordetella pertussis]
MPATNSTVRDSGTRLAKKRRSSGAGSGVGGCERAVTAIGTRHSTRHMATRVSGPSSSVA